MPQIPYLFFDLDGTIMNAKSAILSSFIYVLQKCERVVGQADNLDWCIGPPLRECFATLLNSSDAVLLEQAVVLYREHYDLIGKLTNTVYPGVDATLATLNQHHYTMFVATTQPTYAAN